MNYRILTLLVVLTAAAVAGTLCYHMGTEPALRDAAREGDPMMWLRAEFRLNDDQYARITRLHAGYGEICAQHCRDIQEATDGLNALKAAKPADAGKVSEAEKRVKELESVCERSIEKHVREVAACMPAKEGERYLVIVLPRISSFDHSGPPDVTLRR